MNLLLVAHYHSKVVIPLLLLPEEGEVDVAPTQVEVKRTMGTLRKSRYCCSPQPIWLIATNYVVVFICNNSSCVVGMHTVPPPTPAAARDYD